MQFITSSISTTLVLLLLGLVVFFVLTAHNMSVYVRENISFSVLISDDMKEADILKLQKKLNQEPFVKQSEYISKKQALKEQTEAMGTDPEEFLGYNPFTASLEIKLHSDYANSDSIAKIEKMIKKNSNIQDVLYRKELIDAVNENIRNISLVLLALAGIRITATITSLVQQIPSLYSAYILPELTDFFAWLEELLAKSANATLPASRDVGPKRIAGGLLAISVGATVLAALAAFGVVRLRIKWKKGKSRSKH